MLICLVGAGGANVGRSDTIDEWTPGYSAMKSGRSSNVWSQIDLMLFDGAIITNPPGTKRFDRRVNTILNAGSNYAFPNGGVRTSLKAFGSFEKIEDEEEPKIPTTQSITRVRPAIDFTFINPKGLEIFIGSELYHEFAYDRTTKSSLVTQTSSFSAVSMNSMRFGMMRRGSTWSGGFYYVNGADSERGVTLKVEGIDDEVETSETVQVPPTAGIVASFQVYGFLNELDLALVQASEAPSVSADGINVVDDYLKLRLISYFKISSGYLSTMLAHQTLSYSSNAFVTLDTIPSSLFKIKYIIGEVKSNVFIGGVYGTGSDGLSIPETNESFELQVFGLTTGLYFSF